jgi:hypothetical protein
LEQELVKLAAQADGYSEDLALALWRQANSRVKPGDIHVRNRDQEIDHKLADVINHIVWSMEYFYDDYVEGDSDAADEFERYGRMLRRAMGVWRERHIGHPWSVLLPAVLTRPFGLDHPGCACNATGKFVDAVRATFL